MKWKWNWKGCLFKVQGYFHSHLVIKIIFKTHLARRLTKEIKGLTDNIEQP